MSYIENIKFAERMNQVADLLGIPEKGKNRQKLFGKKFNVSQESARKWLSGESIPKEANFIEIVKEAKVNYEWLKTGRGDMFDYSYHLSNELKQHLKVLQELPDYARTEVIRDAIKTAELISKATSAAKQNGTKNK